MKRFILILVIIAILFGLVVAFGLTRDHSGASTNNPPAWLTTLGDTFTHKTALGPGDVMPSCLQGSDFVFRQPCVAQLRASQSDVREFKLKLTAGLGAKVNLQPKGQTGVTVDLTLKPTEPSQAMQVFSGGAVLTLTCEKPPPGNVPCRTQLIAP